MIEDDMATLQRKLAEETTAREQAEHALLAATQDKSTTDATLAAVLAQMASMQHSIDALTKSSPRQLSSTVPTTTPLVSHADVLSQQPPLTRGKAVASTSTAPTMDPRPRLPSIIEDNRSGQFLDRYNPPRSPQGDTFDIAEANGPSNHYDEDGNDYPHSLRRPYRLQRDVSRTELRPPRLGYDRAPSPLAFGEYDEDDMDLAGELNPGNFHPPLHDPIEIWLFRKVGSHPKRYPCRILDNHVHTC